VTAIAGLVGVDGRPCSAVGLRGAMDILAPLGSDGEGSWSGRAGPVGVALAAVRRRRVPEDDADTQPVVRTDGLVAVADVVLDNRSELCRRLGLADAGDLPDATIVAHAYARWGERCCEHLGGEFAVAVADARRGGVFLGRDHLGIRPLHLYRGPGWVAFASTALAVTGFAGVAPEVDLERAKEFLALVMPSDRSWIRDVVPVPPGTSAWISPAGVRTRRYWRLESRERYHGSAEEHAEELLAVFDEAVRARLRRRGRIGVMLSGGLDSTAVAATVAAEVGDEPVRTYTSVPPPGWTGPASRRDPDESHLVRLLAGRVPNLFPTFVDARGVDVIDGDDELFAAGGTPLRNTLNMAWVRTIYAHATADGVGLLFSGGGGNVSFSRDGERWLVDLLLAGRLPEAWREARAWSAARPCGLAATLRASVVRQIWPGRLGRPTGGGGDPVDAWLAATALRPALGADPGLRHRLEVVAARGAAARRRAVAFVHEGRSAQAEARAAREALAGWRRTDPTTDVRLLRLCAGQPSWARRHRGVDRAGARLSMRGRVPDEIRLRRIRGAQLPDWLDRLTDAYVDICQELAAARAHAPTRALVDLERLAALVRRWPDARRGLDPDHVAAYQFALPRALAVSRYLRWFDEWAAGRRTGPDRMSSVTIEGRQP
jgi:asparagine synthase (glutamine-hydrolysing)